MLILGLFGLMLLIALMRVYLPRGAKTRGKPEKVIRLSLVERYQMQRTNLYAIAAFLFIATITGEMPVGGQFFVLLIAQLILLIPVRCTLSSEGVGINKVVFRPWTDFVGYSAASRRLVLVGRPGLRPLNLSLLAEHQKEVIPFLRRRLPEIEAGKEGLGSKSVIVG
ncbi:MAG TPA: hypothetical protein VI759_06410 [Dehalococcoidia bacterium]|nr:hypothetical protein [Dehalococcoidia bacterium]